MFTLLDPTIGERERNLTALGWHFRVHGDNQEGSVPGSPLNSTRNLTPMMYGQTCHVGWHYLPNVTCLSICYSLPEYMIQYHALAYLVSRSRGGRSKAKSPLLTRPFTKPESASCPFLEAAAAIRWRRWQVWFRSARQGSRQTRPRGNSHRDSLGSPPMQWPPRCKLAFYYLALCSLMHV